MNNQIKKLIPCFLVLLITIVGVFGYGKNVEAAGPTPDFQTKINQCTGGANNQITQVQVLSCLYNLESNGEFSIGCSTTSCKTDNFKAVEDVIYSIEVKTTQTPTAAQGVVATEAAKTTTGSTDGTFQDNIDSGCTINWSGGGWTPQGCILKFVYYFYFQLPTFLLFVAAYFFNVLISLVIQSSMYQHEFITSAWVVVRDLSNIFFILILLYIAIKTVLNMGGHETKSMITSVIIMAVLINFSLFFTKIVIDTSNILALVFYNKLDTKYKDNKGNKVERPNTPVTPDEEKDASGAMYAKFDATRLVDASFIKEIEATTVNVGGKVIGGFLGAGKIFAIKLGIMAVAGTIMVFAAYAFFTSGIFFLGRLIELWILMIFAPFAFMSFAVPKLSHTEYGWEKWSEKLISTAFMAPIFMFFLYLIFKLLEADTFFKGFLKSGNTNFIGTILGIILPALIILGLLLKAKDMAKKGGGQFGEMVMTGAKVLGGVAIAATGAGAAAIGTRVVGGMALKTLANTGLRDRALSGDKIAQKEIESAGKTANRSFDFRDTKLGKFAAEKSGINFNHNKAMDLLGWDTHAYEGGIIGQIKHHKEDEEKKIKAYQLSAGEANEQDRLAGENSAYRKLYERDLKESKSKGRVFDKDSEERFKAQWTKGGDMNAFGLNKNGIEGKIIQTAAEMNKEITKQYLEKKGSQHDTKTEKLMTALKKAGIASATAGGVAVVAGGLGAVTVTGIGAGLAIPIVAGSFLKELKGILMNEGMIHSLAMAEVARPKSTEQKFKELMKETGADKDNKPIPQAATVPAVATGAAPVVH